MLNYNLGSISHIVNGNLFGNAQQAVRSVIIDSRLTSFSESDLFIALVGQRHNGHSYISELYGKGVRAFMVSEPTNFAEQFPDASFVVVSNTLVALQQIAAHHRTLLAYPVIGVTGSNGKTIVKEWLAQLLSFNKRVIRSPKSYNSQVGVPLSVLGMDSHADIAIVEAGVSQPNEMVNLEPIVKPNIGIFTNLGAAHQENFTTLLTKAREKMVLFEHCHTLIYSTHYPEIDEIAQRLHMEKGTQLFTWGRQHNATVWLKDVSKEKYFSHLEIQYDDQEFSVTIPFTDNASVENAMHCLTTLLHLDYSAQQIEQMMGHLQPVAMRLEIKEAINGCTLINDSYNSDVGSLSIALDLLAQQRQHPHRMLILSDILQSGMEPHALYSKVAEMIEEKGVDKTIGIGSEISRHADCFKENSSFFADTHEFLQAFSRQWFKDSAILLKGSRPFQFEHISAMLEHKLHRTQLEVNLDALVHNLNYFRGLLKPNVKVMAMVKAFSYGSGSHEIANLLQFHRVNYLGVAFTDEGIALRDAGITLPIVVLNPEVGSYDIMVEYNLEPEIFSFSSLHSFEETLLKHGVVNYPVHLKIDTGMHRLGFMPKEIDELCKTLATLKGIRVESIFTHLVASEDENEDRFTYTQLELFQAAAQKITETLGYNPLLHVLNSAGIERFKEYQQDMVRLGIGLYGISAIHQRHLKNVGTLKTFVAQIHRLNPGETVGYSRKGVINRPSLIATLPIGYADGLNRRLSNGNGQVLINGHLAPTIGNISMDTCMVDITDIPAVKEGDNVIVFGHNPTITDLAKAIGTIPYEVLTSISQRVKRIYVQE